MTIQEFAQTASIKMNFDAELSAYYECNVYVLDEQSAIDSIRSSFPQATDQEISEAIAIMNRKVDRFNNG